MAGVVESAIAGMAESDFYPTLCFGTGFGQGSTSFGCSWKRTCYSGKVGRSSRHGRDTPFTRSSIEAARAWLLAFRPVSKLRIQAAEHETDVTRFAQNLSCDPDFRKKSRRERLGQSRYTATHWVG